MKSVRKTLFLLGILAAVVLLGACNYPSRETTPTSSAAGALYTAAAQTVNAQLTQVAGPIPTTAVVTGATQTLPLFTSIAPTTAPPPTTAPTSTSVPATATPVPCNLVSFVRDVTYPDDTSVEAGASFVKTWRLRNSGSCTWTTGYALVFASGDKMSAPDAVALPQNVAPGSEVDLSVTLKAPLDPDTYRGNWKLRSADNVVFGLGDGTKPFWVQIKVDVKTGLLYDFLVQASSADWSTGVDDAAGTELDFGGDENAVEGVAKIKDDLQLETGAISGKILLMYPRRETDGYVAGLYPPYKVQSGDRLRANLGFMLLTDECHSGKVRFQITYQEGDGTPTLFKEYVKSCTNSFTDVDVDLTGLAGKQIRFGFFVRAEGDPTDDWAVWNSPRIVH